MRSFLSVISITLFVLAIVFVAGDVVGAESLAPPDDPWLNPFRFIVIILLAMGPGLTVIYFKSASTQIGAIRDDLITFEGHVTTQLQNIDNAHLDHLRTHETMMVKLTEAITKNGSFAELLARFDGRLESLDARMREIEQRR